MNRFLTDTLAALAIFLMLLALTLISLFISFGTAVMQVIEVVK